MSKRLLVFSAAILMALSAAAGAVSNQDAAIESIKSGRERAVGTFTNITDDNVLEVTIGQSDKSESAAMTICNGNWMGTTPLFALSNWFTGAEFYAEYQDPIETGCSPSGTYPFRVDTLKWHVRNPAATTLTITIQGIIWDVDDTDPLCPIPGGVICYSPGYTVNIPAGGVLISLPFPNGCCVYGPYFVGVFVPEFLGTGFLDVVVDSAGANGTFGDVRDCANYNNYRGFHEDLITAYGFPGNMRLWSVGMAADMNSCDQCAQVIEPGVDLWQSPDGSSFEHHFWANPIPADFFDPGSDPFTGRVTLGGDPLNTSPSGVLGPTDAIVRRSDSASLPAPGATDVIDIELVALSLTSTQPISVTYNGGTNPELWDVRVTLSSAASQPPGQMTINKECCNGGTFESTLPVIPKFIFTKVAGTEVRELDLGLLPLPPIQLETQNGFWSYDIPAPFDLSSCPGLVLVDHDLSGSTPDVVLEPSSKFTPGFRTLPCDPGSPNDPYCGGKVLTLEQDQLAQHGVLPPQETTPIEGACCLPDGSCVVTTPDCCLAEGGVYQGDFTLCTPESCEPPSVFDTMCTNGVIEFTFGVTDDDCSEALPPDVLLGNGDTPTIIRRSPDGPYDPGDIIQTEIIQMQLTGTNVFGDVTVRIGENFGVPNTFGQIEVLTTDGSGNLTSGNATYNMYSLINLDVFPLINLAPIQMDALVTELPLSIGTGFGSTPSSTQLIEQGQGPFGYLCSMSIEVAECLTSCCIPPLRGDLNYDGTDANILDLTFAVDRIFRGGPPPVCDEEGDPNADSAVCNILDLTMLVDRIFRGGPPPQPCP